MSSTSSISISTSKYFLPADYRDNIQAAIDGKLLDEEYWNSKRVRRSADFQVQVYHYAAKIISAYGYRTLVDIGCGPGIKLLNLMRRFPELQVIGIDRQRAISYCRQTYNFGTWYVDDVEDPDFSLPEFSGQLIICSDVIEHVRDPDLLLGYIRSHYTEGGLIIISTPDRIARHGPHKLEPKNRYHVREWSFAEFEMYLQNRNFQILDHFSTFPVKIGFNRVFLKSVVRQMFTGKSLRYNQVCLMKPIC